MKKQIVTWTAGVVALLAVALAAGLGATGSASAESTRTVTKPKPTIVFVHGAWADSSSWDGEITRLQQRGYPVIAPANPLRGLAGDAVYLRSVLKTITGPIVLVGHSYGGAVITNAAVGVPNVKALVYVAGFAPTKGESLLQLSMLNPGSALGPDAFTHRPYPLPGGRSSDDLYIAKPVFRKAFAADLPPSVTDRMEASQRPFAEAAFGEPSGAPAWKTVRSWYLIPTRDNAIPPATQRFMAKRAGATVVEVKASHVVMVSQPDATTRLVLAAAQSVRP